jgi:hypothetical protein
MSRGHLEQHAGSPADHDDFGGLHRDLAATREAVEALTAKRFSPRNMVSGHLCLFDPSDASGHLIHVSPNARKVTSGASTPGAAAPLIRTSPLPAGMRR